MVKSVVGDESQLSSAEDRLFKSSLPAQVGLIVGKLSPVSDRGFVYDLIPTPATDGGDLPCSLRSDGVSRDDKKKGSKGGKPSSEPTPSLVIDGDWVAEHGRQVSRMLLGGMYVVGVYVWASEAAFKATSQSVISQTIRGVAQAALFYESEVDERLLIHISYSPRRWTCRNCAVNSGSLRPCDFKMGKLLNSLQIFRCTYHFDMRLPVDQAKTLKSNIKNILSSGISRLGKDLRSAKALVDGDLMNNNQQNSSSGVHKVELLLPFKQDPYLEACSSDEVTGLLVFSGSICASAYLGPKELTSQAVSDLKGDIINSLRSRLDIIFDEAEGETLSSGGEASSETANQKSIHHLNLNELREPYFIHFPRRVLVPWLDGLSLCDYLQSSETFEDLKDRLKEMMSIETAIDTSAILEPEAEVALVTTRSFWDVINGSSAVSPANGSKSKEHSTESSRSSGETKTSNFNFVIAILILLTAVIVGCAITIFGASKPVH